jgi:DNA polymerase III subunit beta
MKFTVERDALTEAVTWAARALPSRPVIPVLAGLLLHASDGALTLSCFDYEVSARMRVPAEVSEPGTALVPGRLFAEITRSLPGLPADIADDPDGLSITCGEAAFTVATLPSAEYPELPELPLLAGVADGGVLAAAIGQVTPAASRDDTLPMLTAVSLELTAATMTLAATDRYRLAVRDLDWSPASWIGEQTEAGGRTSVLVPARIFAEAARMMSPGVPVRVFLRDPDSSASATTRTTAGADPSSADAMIGFEAGERRLTSRLLAGEFIKYRSRFPAEFGNTADLPAEAFSEAVRRVSLVAERGTPVQLSFAPGRMTIGAATQGQARARETVPADFAGDEPVIAFNPHYLLDGIVAASVTGHAHTGTPPMPDGTRIRLQFSSASKPAVITRTPPEGAAESDFRYLVVPQRVQS